MADALVCSSSGLDKGPNGAGQVTHFVSATRSSRNRELQNDAATSNTGRRPELPAYVNLTMKELLHACWHAEPRERSGWASIIKTLKEELMLHPPGSQQPKRRAPPRIEKERKETQDAVTNLKKTSISWLDAVVQGLDAEVFATWKAKIDLEMLPILYVISKLHQALWQDPYTIKIVNPQPTFWETNSTFNEVLCAFDEAWQMVKETWANHVTGRFRLGASGTDLIDGSEMETIEEGPIDAKRETERTVWEIWANEVLEPYNLLGSTAEDWLKKILVTSKEWQVFRATLNAWHTENQNSFRSWQDKLQESSRAWKTVCVAIHAWHVKSPTAFTAWQALKKENMSTFLFYCALVNTVLPEIYLKVHKAPELEATMGSIKAWKAVEVEKVTIRSMFLENTIDIAKHAYL
ncbi:unnamed protein product [Sphagnum balticum]